VKRLLSLTLVGLLAACAGTDNSPQPTPLAKLTNQVGFDAVWKAAYTSNGLIDSVWHSSAKGSLYHFAPDTTGDAIYMAGTKGIAGFSLTDGHRVSEFSTDAPLAGGLGAENGVVVVGTLKGDALAYSVEGKLLWQVKLSSEVIAPPVMAEGIAVVRTVDGHLWGLSLADGKVRWQFQRNQPSLILRNYAPVTVSDGVVYIGLAGGRMAALTLQDGRVMWDSQVALPKGATELERVTDVTSAPIVDRYKGHVCAVAYQGKVACFAISNGTQLWSREISSYVGLALDGSQAYVSDVDGNVQAFDRNGGRSLWKQAALYGRRVSGPVAYKGYIAVGDYEGYVHLLSAADGSIVARYSTDKSRIVVPPRVVGDKLMVQTEGGGLYALAVK